jgi:iron-sulfur cluster repair protein YtfE (RIC family)
MQATQLLSKQHRKVEAIFGKLEKEPPNAEELVEALANDLAGHMTIEQEIFYPAIQEVDRDLVLESYEEHALAEVALKRLMAVDPENESWKARVVALKELIEHHVKEEEDELFPQVEKALGEERSSELGRQMKKRFEEVVAAGFESAVPRGYAKTSSDVSKKSLKKASPSKPEAA